METAPYDEEIGPRDTSWAVVLIQTTDNNNNNNNNAQHPPAAAAAQRSTLTTTSRTTGRDHLKTTTRRARHQWCGGRQQQQGRGQGRGRKKKQRWRWTSRGTRTGHRWKAQRTRGQPPQGGENENENGSKQRDVRDDRSRTDTLRTVHLRQEGSLKFRDLRRYACSISWTYYCIVLNIKLLIFVWSDWNCWQT